MEIRRLALQRLPNFMKTWVVEKEQKKEQQKPLLQLIAREGISEENMKASMRALIGQEPKSVVEKGDRTYWVKMGNEEAGKKLLALHMKPLKNSPRPLQVTLLEQPMEILEMFDFLHGRLMAKEKVEMYSYPVEKKFQECANGSSEATKIG